jgi:MFS family permease
MNSRVALSVAVLFAINLLNFYDRNVPGALAEPMRREFGLTDQQLGIIGSAFIWLYAVVGVPLGRLADVWSRRKLMAGGVVVWTLFTFSVGLATSFPTLIFSRLGTGVGEAVCAPAGTSWLGDLFPASKRAKVMAVFMLAFPIGNAMGLFFSGPIAQVYGWRAAMMFAAAPALVLVPALLFLKEPERGAAEASKPAEAGGSHWAVLKIPTLWWIVASGIFLNFNMYALASFLPALFLRVHKISLAEVGLWTGSVYLVGGVAGGLLAGYLGDRVGGGKSSTRLVIAAIFAAVSAPFWYFGILASPGAVAMTFACVAVGFGGLNAYYGLTYSAMQDIVGPRERGFAMALYFLAMYAFGAAFGPVLTGTVSDRLARRAMAEAGASAMSDAFRATGLQQAMLVVPLLAVFLTIVLLIGSRTITRDAYNANATR